MSRVLSGVTNETFKSMQLGVGIIIKNFAYSAIATPTEFKAALEAAISGGQGLGATLGGININVVPEMRQRQFDGATVRFKNDSVIDSWTSTISTTLKEFSPQVLQVAFPTAEFTEIGQAEDMLAMRIRTSLEDTDYAENYTWVGTTDFGYLMISMFNALAATSGDITAADKAEGGIPVTITGHAEGFDDAEFAPCEIWFINDKGGIVKNPLDE